jgi:hypothetical protein
VIVLFVATITIAAYVLSFWDRPLSHKTEDWASFATYLSGTMGVAAVVATLIAFVFTLRQQNSLIDNQHELLINQEKQLEQSKDMLELEEFKLRDKEALKSRDLDSTYVYLIHHFENLENMFSRARGALEENDAEYFIAVYDKHPAFYSEFLLEKDSEVISFFNKFDEPLARRCIGAVVNAKTLYEVISYNVKVAGDGPNKDSKVRQYMQDNLSSERKSHLFEVIQCGFSDTKYFLGEANKIRAG